MKLTSIDYNFERRIWRDGRHFVAGVDEAGRGPLAGPVVAAAVIFAPEVWIHGVDDSKKLSSLQREHLYDVICGSAISTGVGIVNHEVIDRINIYQASMLAMRQAVAQLKPMPNHLFVDGPRYHDHSIPFTPIIGGDAKCFAIAAASIVAKVTRDRLMTQYEMEFPHYGFVRHKGYATKEHLQALRKYGPCSIHRRTFRMPGVRVETATQ